MNLWVVVFIQLILRFVHLHITYVLSRDCRILPNQDFLLHHPVTNYLQVDNLEGSMVLLSHNMTHYPRNFSCELVVHTPIENAKIMMKIEEFYIPSKTTSCVENYLYVFDSNTAKSKAMPEAGGERGLCGPDYPKNLIFTSKSYICIAFHTSFHRPPILPGMKPGFRVILTAIQETALRNNCASDNFYCGSFPRFMASHPMLTLDSLSSDRQLYRSSLSLSQNMQNLDNERFAFNHNKQTMGYCITKKSLCDGIVNCEDGKDEDISRCQALIGLKNSNGLLLTDDATDSNNWLSGFLSLGIPASIAIAVSTIVIFTFGIGVVICCCHRCCRINQAHNNNNNQYLDNRLTFGNGGVFCDTFNHPTNGTNCGYYTSQNTGIISVNAGAQSQLSDRMNLISHVDCDQRNITKNWKQIPSFPSDIVITGMESYSQQLGYNMPNQHFQAYNQCLTSSLNATNEKEAQSHCFIQNPIKLGLMDRPYPSVNPNETMGSQYFASVGHHGSDSYSSINTNSARGYDQVQNGPTGPPPALIHGTLGSPYTYRKDPLCYTPPLYGACNVPPASSVTASSSRTGTTSGGPRESVKSRRDHSASAVGHINSRSGSGLELFNQQLNGVGSALHTNTPIETISYGGDLSSNGGIVYLGEMYRPLSPQDSSLSLVDNRGHSSVTTTTGSGSSSRDKKSHQYFLKEAKSHHEDSHAFIQRNPHQQSAHDSCKNSSRRSKTPSHRHHHHHLKHKSTDPNRNISSGSHTPASSRSGVLSSYLPQRTCDKHEQSFSQYPMSTVITSPNTSGPSNYQPIVFPVEL
ncbi:Beta-hexosaminidase subunit alpha [Schistosoma japonicum]|nr:Beta-hexosaminidase subunit alpha [Schistosoma japonicum]